MNAEGLEELFGRISVATNEIELHIPDSDPEALQTALRGVGQAYFQTRDQRKIDDALEHGTISQQAAQRLTATPGLYRNWFLHHTTMPVD